ncbi:biotin/lipoate A/B protein ligase family protein [Silvanigrella sp.]|jgi:lipoate-protein ligase A|uniref:biotin/lipoate A/B protein ligase family protein n=1 Tax=Silvanigrella sp. TaxID=2024976 RepID=UPI0037C50284
MWMDNWVLNLPKKYWPKYKSQDLNENSFLFRFFETKRNVVVLSSSNKPDIEANVLACETNNVPILRRKGGGGTVVLGEGCLILTFAFYAKDVFGNNKYFQMINQLWINALKEAGCPDLSQNGISDISFLDKKIAGTSIFRKKHLLVYQGSLLVNPNIEFISQLLAHPSREPDYRQGRDHNSFLTTTQKLGCPLTTSELADHCQAYFKQHVAHFFQNEILDK